MNFLFQTRKIFQIIIFSAVICLCPLSGEACTSAIIGADRNPYGRPLLWKHRDTSNIDNKVEYILASEEGMGYVALFNASDLRNREAWMGMNDAGFAVMNTASYNIKDDRLPESEMDREGFVMTLALRTCRSVDDFQRLLEKLPRPMGVEANFGVIDASGNGAFFETNNHSFVRYDLSDAPDQVLIRTNYSHSGRKGEGYGQVREANARHLLRPYVEAGTVTPEVLTEVVSRSFYRSVQDMDYATGEERIIADVDFIPRYKSTGTFVIEGMKPVDDISMVTPEDVASQYIMWTGMGYPPCAEIIPVWCAPEGVDESLRGVGNNGHSPQCDIVKARRDDVFSSTRDKKTPYINLDKLFNDRGTGYVQQLRRQNHEVYERVIARRDGKTEKDD